MTQLTPTELLPKGEFIITQKDGQKSKGRFSMFVLDRFCEDRKIANYFDLLEKIITGMSVRDYADLVLFALQDYYRSNVESSNYTRESVMDMLDDLGGLASEDFAKLVRHAAARIAALSPEVKKENSVPSEDSKKKEELTSTETGSGLNASEQE